MRFRCILFGNPSSIKRILMDATKFWFLLAASSLMAIQPVAAQELRSLNTPDLRLLHFDLIHTYLAPHAARCYQNALARHQSILGFEPDEETTVFLKDYSDYGNASAIPVPRNTILVEISPVNFTFETLATSERMCTLMNHELAHLVMTDQATRADKRARKFFGGKVAVAAAHPETIFYSYLTNPRFASARWYHEGIAVFMETWMAGGLGRAQGAYDEMVFRSMVRDDAHFYDPLGLESEGSKVDFQVGVNNYLYGARFMSYLAYTYSPEMLVSWVTRKEGSKGYFTAQFEHVFGIPMEQAWQNWIEFEHDFQNRNLEAVREYPITPYKDISDRGLGSVSRTYFDPETRKLYSALRYPGVVAHISEISIDDGSIRKIVDVKGPMGYKVTSLAFDSEANSLYYAADNYAYRDLMELDIESGESRMLLRDARIGELVLNKADRSLWGVRHLNGIVTLVRIPYPYDEWNQIHSFPYGEVLYDLDISPDGELLSTSFGEVNGDQSLKIFHIEELLEGNVTPVHQFDFGLAVPEGFVFSPDGEFLYGSTYYTGISNIFRYELATKEIEAVSNAESGFFRPVPLDDGTMLVLRYTGQGFLPAIIDPQPLEDVSAISFFGTEIVRKYPELQDWQVGSPADIPLGEMITYDGDYSGIRKIGLESTYPIIEGYKDEIALGMNATFSDPLMLDRIDFSVSHSINSSLPSSEDIHAILEWQHLVTRATPLSGKWTMSLRNNPAYFYDLFGPTKQSLKGQSGTIAYEKTLIYDEPRQLNLNLDLSHYTNLDRLPRYQNVDVTFDKLTSLVVDLNYSHMRSSLGHVDDEKGFKWRMIAAADYVNGDTIPKFFGNFDFGFALPWKHSSIWLRNAVGAAFGEPNDEFANFFFGGFGNNYVDRGLIKRYREHYAMPGFELNELAGRNFHRAMFEWNLSPLRFRRVGTPGFYLSWARPALFVSHLTTNLDDSLIRDERTSAGLQIDFRFTMLSRLDMTLSLGYAKRLGESLVIDDDEFMVSLKIL